MSLGEVVNAGDANVIPGYTLREPTWDDLAELEVAATQAYIDAIHKATTSIKDGPAKDVFTNRMLEAASRNLLESPFAYGGINFRLWVTSAAGMRHFIWVCIRGNHPTVTLGATSKLVTDHYIPCRNFLFNTMGLTRKKKVTPQTPTSPSTAPPSPDASQPPPTTSPPPTSENSPSDKS
jgi:hypothetical protein